MMLKYGRRLTIIISTVFFIIGPTLMALAWDVFFVIIGRIVIGFGVGISSVVVPCYLGEVSSYQFRGFVVSLYEVAIAVGMLMAVSVDLLVAIIFGGDSLAWLRWRVMVFIPVIFAIILLIFSAFMLPESPRWLVMKGRFDEALAVLHRLRDEKRKKRKGVKLDDDLGKVEKGDAFEKEKRSNGESKSDDEKDQMIAEIELELLNIWSNSEQEKAAISEQRNNFIRLGKGGKSSKKDPRTSYDSPEIDGSSVNTKNTLALANQEESMEKHFSVESKSTSNDSMAKGSEKEPSLFTTLYTIIIDILVVARGEEQFSLFVVVVLAILNQFVASTAIINYGTTIMALVGIDDEEKGLGRTVAVSFCKFAGIILSTFLVDVVGRRPLLLIGSFGMTIGMVLLNISLIIFSSGLAMTGLLVFIFTFSLSWAGIFWVIVSELFSMASKSSAMSLASFSLFLAGAGVNLTFNNIVDGIETYWPLLFAGFAAFSFFFVYITLPETKQKPLSDVQHMMQKRASVIKKRMMMIFCCYSRKNIAMEF